ncbi:MAG: hypothetical protein ABSD27_07530 [Bryobacteraceae bacterium]
MSAFRGLLHAAACSALAASAWAVPCRLTLADQSDWNNNIGFYLDLENDGQPCMVGNMKVALGVADGSHWRFVVFTPVWQLDRDYSIVATIQPGSAQLSIDGQPAGALAGGFAPLLQQQVSAGAVPGWANGATDYLVVQTRLSIQSSGGQSATVDFQDAQRPVPLMLLAPGASKSTPWSASANDTWTVTATFHLSAYPNLRSYDPHIDRYGQSVYADWSGKIRSDDDLQSAAATEQAKLQDWSATLPVQFDPYGGLLGAWSDPGPAFFRVVEKNGMWWLVTPLGNPVFYIGLDTAPALNWDRTPVTGRESMFTQPLPPRDPLNTPPSLRVWGINSWGQNDGTEDVSFNTVNMRTKYGAEWDAVETDLTLRRMQAWGFSGFGKWAGDAGNRPIIPVLGRGDVPNLVRHPDVFDPAVQVDFWNSLSNQISARVNDPLVVGWSLGNEFDEIVTAQETSDILKLGAGVAAKRALVDEALASIYANDVGRMAVAWGVTASTTSGLYAAVPSPPPADIEHLRQFLARRYYGFIYGTVKQLDPNHLYFGFWIVPGWWENEDDWRLIAPYCDAIGYDRYAEAFVDPVLDRLMRETGKPVLLGEFSFPAHYNLMRGFRPYAAVSVTDDAASGDMYAKWLSEASRNPYVVGVGWFQYRDEPVSGRGPGQGPDLVYGEDYAFGLVDVGDRPKYDLVERVRTADFAAARTRLNFVRPVMNQGGAVDAATFAPGGPVAPGGLMSIFGTGLDGVTMLRMGGYSVPILYAGPLQINAQVPWELAGQTGAKLTASNGNEIDVPLATYSPGIFAALPNAGGTKVRRGDYVVIYANGLGPVTIQPPTGAAGPWDPLATTIATPTVTIGGLPARVSFSGLHPIWVGLYQVNAQVPTAVAPGDSVSVVLEIAGQQSNQVMIGVE